MPLFSDEEFKARALQALSELDSSEWQFAYEHLHRETTGARMSGAGDCGRKQVYAANGTIPTNPRNPMDHWNALSGSILQNYTALLMRKMGYTITNEEADVALEDGLITGHLDGEISGLDLGDEIAIWDSKYKNAWGLYGTKASFGIVTEGLPYSSPQIYLQMQLYMLARQRQRAIVTISPFDMSTTKQQAAIKKVDLSPLNRVVVEADEDAQRLGVQRSQLVAAAVTLGVNVTPEFDPNREQFPCTYCDFRAQCIIDGPAAPFSLPPIPVEWKTPPSIRLMQEVA